ncbi:MAG: hypothetical protein IKS87_00890, partial [Lachnospiraceae bacterium]|nr:hypothetical protein [Lachnospiraceae bacterium]
MENVGYQMSGGTIAFCLIITVVSLVAMWMIFTKAGEPGWKCLIPIYSAFIEFKLFWGGSGWAFLLLLIPLVNIVICFMFYWRLCKSFGKGGGFFVLMLLL